MALSYSTLRKPVNPQIIDPSTGRMREEWVFYFDQLTTRLNAAVGLGDVFGPASAGDGNLPSFDGTDGKTLQDSGIAASEVLVDGDIGVNVQAYAANLDGWAAEDPNDYSTTAEADADYQPFDADLTAIAALSDADGNFIVGTGSGWAAESGETARVSLGLGTAATQGFLDEDDMASNSETDVPSQQSVKTYVDNSIQTIVLGTASELTIASGAITVVQSNHLIDTESDAASDDLDTINGGSDGQLLFLQTADSGRDVTVKNLTGNISCGSDRLLSSLFDVICLKKRGSTWFMISFADNN